MGVSVFGDAAGTGAPSSHISEGVKLLMKFVESLPQSMQNFIRSFADPDPTEDSKCDPCD
jgi:hypothetical protein